MNQSLITIALWPGWCDTGGDQANIRKNASLDKELARCAKEVYNLGNIASEVKIDGQSVANLNVRNALTPSGKSDYKINSLENVTELYTKAYNLTIPPDSQMPNLNPGTWLAGSHGWFVFLKPLPPGEHSVFYNVRVTPTGALTSPGLIHILLTLPMT